MSEPVKVADGEALPLVLKWEKTWPDRENDFAALAEGYLGPMGRIYRHDYAPQEGRWTWSMTGLGYDISRNAGACHGFADSVRDAAYAVEQSLLAAIKGSKLDQPEPKRNAHELENAGE